METGEVWWHWGTKEDVLDGKSVIKASPGGPKPPLMLESEDEVLFRSDGASVNWRMKPIIGQSMRLDFKVQRRSCRKQCRTFFQKGEV